MQVFWRGNRQQRPFEFLLQYQTAMMKNLFAPRIDLQSLEETLDFQEEITTDLANGWGKQRATGSFHRVLNQLRPRRGPRQRIPKAMCGNTPEPLRP